MDIEQSGTQTDVFLGKPPPSPPPPDVANNPIYLAAVKAAETLEDVLSSRKVRANMQVTRDFGRTDAIKIAAAAIRRAMDECAMLIELNPKATDAYLRSLGEVTAKNFNRCKLEAE